MRRNTRTCSCQFAASALKFAPAVGDLLIFDWRLAEICFESFAMVAEKLENRHLTTRIERLFKNEGQNTGELGILKVFKTRNLVLLL